MNQMKSEVKDGMRIDWDAPIQMDDGVVLRADVYRPVKDGKYPILITYGPYGKGLHFKEGYPMFWNRIERDYPEVLKGTTAKYMNWETVDPEKWIPDGYACIRVDSRGAGRSPGVIDCWSPREIKDFYDCIEWAAVQPWSNGKVGLLGISYFAMTQWAVAALQPPHLVAICPFEGCNDLYREGFRHGGIKHEMFPLWYPVQVRSVQHGLGKNGKINHNTGEYISGPETLSPEELAKNITDLPAELQKRELIDGYHKDRITDLSKIKVPVLSCGNWGGNALHLRGNIEGYMQAASKEKWLEIHGLEHFTEFYTPYGVALQKRFFDHFLKGMDTWKDQPPVYLRLRKVDGSFKDRAEREWPLARTQWTKFYLDTQDLALSTQPVKGGKVSFEALGAGLTFLTPPLKEEMEITGPIAAKLFVASSTKDADIFLTIRVLDPDGKDVTFVGASDPKNVIATGWLRASHRKLDRKLSLPYRPWHVHDEKQMLTPGEIYELDVEVWPTSVIVPKGYRVGVAVMGKDFELPGDGPWPFGYGVHWKGNALYVHIDPKDRPPEIYGGKTTLASGDDKFSYLMLPVIPTAK
jgi:uncharacterized protein